MASLHKRTRAGLTRWCARYRDPAGQQRTKTFVRKMEVHYRSLVLAPVGLGLRISEACGLRVVDVDFLRNPVHVRQQRRPGATQ